MINIHISLRQVKLNNEEVSLAIASNARSSLLPEFLKKLNKNIHLPTHQQIQIHESVIKSMITKYSEQLIYQPLNEIRHWFGYTSGAFIEPGYQPLFYSRVKNKKVSPNKSAISGIGEGIAGLIAQRLYRCRKLARPNHDYPDIIMANQNKTFIIESKSTISLSIASLDKILKDEFSRFATYLSACQSLDKRPVQGLLVGTNITAENIYHVSIYEVEI